MNLTATMQSALAATFMLLASSHAIEKADKPESPGTPPAPKEETPADPAQDAGKLAASAAKWEKLKAACGGNYSYKMERASFFGYRAETILVVRNNKVVEREFWESPSGKPTPLEKKWKETAGEVGTLEGTPAAAPRTLDELYIIAAKIAGTEPAPHHFRMLGFDQQGLLQHCFTQDRRDRDDAPITGVSGVSDISIMLK